MSFQTNICNVMTSDTSLNSMLEGIYFNVLPIDFDLKEDWIVYNYREEERIDVLSEKNVLTIYTLYAKIVTPDTNNLLTISDELNRYLTNYKSSNFLDISFVGDNHNNGIVDDTDIYENTIEYSISYRN